MPWNLPFQPDVGIQTSILMSESLVGLRVAATRQNAGRPRNACAAAGGVAAPPPEIGSVNAPGPTARASVIVVLGSLSDARLSHGWAAVAVNSPFAVTAASAPPPTSANISAYFMKPPPFGGHDLPQVSRCRTLTHQAGALLPSEDSPQ